MKARKSIKKVAKQEGVSIDDVRREMQTAIDEGMKSTEPQAVEFWKKSLIMEKGQCRRNL